MSKEFFDIEKHPIANNLNLLINYLKKLKTIKGSNFFTNCVSINNTVKACILMHSSYLSSKFHVRCMKKN